MTKRSYNFLLKNHGIYSKKEITNSLELKDIDKDLIYTVNSNTIRNYSSTSSITETSKQQYMIDKGELTDTEIHNVILLKQVDSLNAIKNILIFFVFLIVVGILISFLNYIN